MDLIEPPKFHPDDEAGLKKRDEIITDRGKYGIALPDIICLHSYLGLVISNGLKLLAEHEHGWPGTEEFPTPEIWESQLLEVAAKLEQASTVDDQINKMHDEIDWSEEDFPKEPEDFEDWLNSDYRSPAFQEYSRRSDEIHALAQKNAREALEWLGKYWFALWD